MSRYIDADKFKSDIKDVAEITCGSFTEFEVLGILSGQPTADVRENVRGEWLHISDGYCDFLKCSQCGKTTDSQSNFCPNCGADMRGGKHGEIL